MIRDVQGSLFPEIARDRSVGRLVPSVLPGTNADLIAEIAPIYLDGRSVLDVTYGNGVWWRRYTPERFGFHDLKIDGVDFRSLPYPDGAWDVVCYDPPYVPHGGTTLIPDAIERFGLKKRNADELDELMQAGFVEACRVASEFVLVKCMSAVSGGELRCGPMLFYRWADQIPSVRLHDVIVHHSGPPMGGQSLVRAQVRTSRHNSDLLVFRKIRVRVDKDTTGVYTHEHEHDEGNPDGHGGSGSGRQVRHDGTGPVRSGDGLGQGSL